MNKYQPLPLALALTLAVVLVPVCWLLLSSNGQPDPKGKAAADRPAKADPAPSEGLWCADVRQLARDNEAAARRRFGQGVSVIGYVEKVRVKGERSTLFLTGNHLSESTQLTADFAEALDKLEPQQPVLIQGQFDRTRGPHGVPHLIDCRLVKVARSLRDIGGDPFNLARGDPDFEEHFPKK